MTQATTTLTRADPKHAAAVLRARSHYFSSWINRDGEVRDGMCGRVRNGFDEGLVLRLTAPLTVR